MKDWLIVISSEKGYRLLSMSVLRQNIIHLTVKFSFRYCINAKATHNCPSGPAFFKKRRNEKKRKYNGLKERQRSLSGPDFPFRSSLKHRNTDPRNRNL